MKHYTCGKLIRKKCLAKAAPCLQPKGHRGHHTPDLTGMQIYNYTILHRAPDQVRKNSYRRTRWWVVDKYGDKRMVTANALFNGDSQGRVESNTNSTYANGKMKPEYATWRSHLGFILRSKQGTPAYKSYHGIPVYDGWNSAKGGTYKRFSNWISIHLGSRPKKARLHIVPINKGGKGFGPWRADDGGWSVRWLSSPENLAVENKRFVEHRSNQEFAAEAMRRGFVLVHMTA